MVLKSDLNAIEYICDKRDGYNVNCFQNRSK